ncbi:MAG TPA: YoaK family protein [Pseudonocardiaceae bacterium]|nr:YoaK family protein [Pseudonocardiaceae bacterium]
MAVTAPIDRRWLVGALLTLTAVTGLIDAVSYLRLGHVFVANMTGNVVFFGLTLDPHSGVSPVTPAVAIAGFLAGAVVGGLVARRLDGRPRVWLCAALGVQAGILAVAAVLVAVTVLPAGGRPGLFLVAPLGVCFGLQNATVRRLGVADLTTTVLTLTLTGLAADSVLGGSSPHRRIGSVVCMLAGAAIGALLLRVGVAVVVGLAAVLVAGVAVVFGRAPSPRPVTKRPRKLVIFTADVRVGCPTGAWSRRDGSDYVR